MSPHDDPDFRRRIQQIATLIEEVEQTPDPKSRARLQEIIQGTLDLHGAGLERIFDRIAATGESGLAMIDELAKDDLIGNLLILHGLHPLDFETRVRQALDKTRPYLHTHGGNVELLSADDGVVRLRLSGSCQGCPSSSMTLKHTIEEAIYEMAPDVVAIEVEGLSKPAPIATGTTGFIAVETLQGTWNGTPVSLNSHAKETPHKSSLK